MRKFSRLVIGSRNRNGLIWFSVLCLIAGMAGATSIFPDKDIQTPPSDGTVPEENFSELVPDDFYVAQPAGNVIIPENAPGIQLPLAAVLVFPSDMPAAPTVGFVLDGVLLNVSVQFEVYTTAAWLAPGRHELAVTAEIPLPPADNSEVPEKLTWRSDPVIFDVTTAPDTDENGLPDAGYGVLADVGDLWIAADFPDGMPRWTALARLIPDGLDYDLLLPVPGVSGGLARLNIPAVIAENGIAHVAGLALGRNESALAVTYEDIEKERPSTPVPPGVFSLTALFREDQGVWREAGDAVPGGAPLRLSLTGLRVSPGFMAYPAVRNVDYVSETANGPLIPALTESGWYREPDILAETPIQTGFPAILRIAGTGMAAVFQQGVSSNLRVSPGGESGYVHLGILPAGKPFSQQFILANPGRDVISGQCQLTGDSAFRLLEPAAYTLPPGQSTAIQLIFLPTAEGHYAADLVFPGGNQGLLTIRVEAQASGVPVKARQLFVCGSTAGSNRLGSRAGDWTAMALALCILMGARRTCRKSKGLLW